jgi:hypothetical protein
VIQRKRRTAKQRALLKYKQTADVGIGFTRKHVKMAKQAAEKRHRDAVRLVIFSTRDLACRVTGVASEADHMHEDPPRSLTRNLPPELRFNLKVCIRLSPRVHRLVTDEKITLTKLDPDRGFDGPIAWTGYREIPAGSEGPTQAAQGR